MFRGISVLSIRKSTCRSKRTVDMKPGLVLVLIVAGVLPSLCEGRIVSKCELRNKLGEIINLPSKYEKHKDQYLAQIICEVSARSNLNTNLVKEYGIRKRPTTPQPTTRGGMEETVPPFEEFTTEDMDMEMTTTTTKATTTTTVAASAAGSRRRKRSSKSKKSKKSKGKHSSEESMNSVENKFDEEQEEEDDEHMRKGDSSEESHNDPSHITPWSLGYYGIFQLKDSHFCDSGYRWSRNVCNAQCSDFTDDDISDDIICFVDSGYWRKVLRNVTRKCRKESTTLLNDCS